MNIALLRAEQDFGLRALRHRLFNFSLGTPSRDALVMTHSGAATPGRYVAEMARRAAEMGRARGVVVLNPQLELSPAELGLIVNVLVHHGRRANPLVVRDGNNRPLGYRLTGDLLAGCAREVALLSTVDADVDCHLLSALSKKPVATVTLPVSFTFRVEVAGFGGAAQPAAAYVWAARRAARELGTTRSPARIPGAAVLPFHAGDVLFLLLALKRSDAPIRAVVVEPRYREIVKAVAPELECIEMNVTAGSGQSLDMALVEQLVQDHLPAGHLYWYCRPSRRYDSFPVHLIDQYAFACATVPPAGTVRDVAPPDPARGRGDRRILLHFDGGWPIKIYPEDLQRELADRLAQVGFGVTIARARDDRATEVPASVRLRDLSHLRDLLRAHDLLIGMDSFPVHYATHVLGLPTICLFASTQPANSDAMRSARYRALEEALECRPCGALAQCPRFGGDACRNFTPPERVVAEAVQMWSRIYDADAGDAAVAPRGPAESEAGGAVEGARAADAARRAVIWIHPAGRWHYLTRIRLERRWPAVMALVDEFKYKARIHGRLGAIRLAIRLILRKLAA